MGRSHTALSGVGRGLSHPGEYRAELATLGMVVPTLDVHAPGNRKLRSTPRSQSLQSSCAMVVGPDITVPAAINTILGRVSAPAADAGVDRGAAGFHHSVAVGPLVDARPVGAGKEGAEQGVSGILLVETGAAPRAQGDRTVNVEIGSQRRLERSVVGQLHLGEDGGVHAVKGLLWSAAVHGCTSLRHVSAFGGSSVKGAGMLGQ